MILVLLIKNEVGIRDVELETILEGVVKRGTGKKLKPLNVPLAGKTGTTNNNFDAWFIGFT